MWPPVSCNRRAPRPMAPARRRKPAWQAAHQARAWRESRVPQAGNRRAGEWRPSWSRSRHRVWLPRYALPQLVHRTFGGAVERHFCSSHRPSRHQLETDAARPTPHSARRRQRCGVGRVVPVSNRSSDLRGRQARARASHATASTCSTGCTFAEGNTVTPRQVRLATRTT